MITDLWGLQLNPHIRHCVPSLVLNYLHSKRLQPPKEGMVRTRIVTSACQMTLRDDERERVGMCVCVCVCVHVRVKRSRRGESERVQTGHFWAVISDTADHKSQTDHCFQHFPQGSRTAKIQYQFELRLECMHNHLITWILYDFTKTYLPWVRQ